jgi:hypothetical protein
MSIFLTQEGDKLGAVERAPTSFCCFTATKLPLRRHTEGSHEDGLMDTILEIEGPKV